MIRGSLFQSLPEFIRLHFGAHRFQEFLSLVEPVARDALADNMQALAWYPFAVVASASEAMVKMSTPEKSESVLQEFAKHNLDRATNLIFRAIFRVGSPEFMVSKSDQVWRKYYSTGRMHVIHVARGSSRVRLYEFPQMTATYNRVILYAIEATIVKAGGQIKTRELSKDTSAGDPFSEYTHTWSI